jgi:hypothetical protein
MTKGSSFVLLLVVLPMVPGGLRVLCWCVPVVSVCRVRWFGDVMGGRLLGLAAVAFAA